MANYINNKEFYQMLVDYKEQCRLAEKNGEPTPRIPENIGHCFYMIATRLGTKWKFSGYTYREEMVSDALENCVVAIHNFNPEKSKNPFAYFTQIIYFAFLRRIEKEKKQTFVKYKSLEHFLVDASLNDEDAAAYSNFDITNDKMKPILEKYERKPTTKKAKDKRDEGITRFIEGV